MLRATGAILPTAFEASLFSVEMNWPGQAFAQFGGTKEETDLARIANEASAAYLGARTVRWGNEKELKADMVHRISSTILLPCKRSTADGRFGYFKYVHLYSTYMIHLTSVMRNRLKCRN